MTNEQVSDNSDSSDNKYGVMAIVGIIITNVVMWQPVLIQLMMTMKRNEKPWQPANNGYYSKHMTNDNGINNQR